MWSPSFRKGVRIHFSTFWHLPFFDLVKIGFQVNNPRTLVIVTPYLSHYGVISLTSTTFHIHAHTFRFFVCLQPSSPPLPQHTHYLWLPHEKYDTTNLKEKCNSILMIPNRSLEMMLSHLQDIKIIGVIKKTYMFCETHVERAGAFCCNVFMDLSQIICWSHLQRNPLVIRTMWVTEFKQLCEPSLTWNKANIHITGINNKSP